MRKTCQRSAKHFAMDDKTFLVGDTVYFAESMRWLREAKVLRVDGDNCVIRFTDNGGGIRTRINKLYATEKEAQAAMALPAKPAPLSSRQRKKKSRRNRRIQCSITCS